MSDVLALELRHYTSEPMAFDPMREYTQDAPSSFGKPVGFWVSVTGEDDWMSWVTDNMNEERLNHAARVTITPTARVHVITNDFALDAFTGEYAVQTDYERRWPHRVDDKAKWPIDWREVAKDSDGLIIAPYIWSRRYSHDWYYGWDCASGCIWNLTAIAAVDLITEPTNA